MKNAQWKLDVLAFCSVQLLQGLFHCSRGSLVSFSKQGIRNLSPVMSYPVFLVVKGSAKESLGLVKIKIKSSRAKVTFRSKQVYKFVFVQVYGLDTGNMIGAKARLEGHFTYGFVHEMLSEKHLTRYSKSSKVRAGFAMYSILD